MFSRSVFSRHPSKGLSNQADIELDMINAMSAADIAFVTVHGKTYLNAYPLDGQKR